MVQTDIAIIGAGPAGMMAAIAAADGGKKIVIFEANTTAGRKLLLTGRGRCNLTHSGTQDEIIKAFAPFDRFVRHCIYEFTPQMLIDFFRQRGLDSVADEEGCFFPVTNSSSDVNRILLDELQKKDVKIYYGRKIQAVSRQGDVFVIPCEKFSVSAKALIIATGGMSWPQTGSTGDGYKFAKELGHKIISPAAALVPLVTKEKFCGSLAGLGIGQVAIRCKADGKKINVKGPMLFTHTGIGGPAVMDLSRTMAGRPDGYEISIDLLPQISPEQLDKRLTQLFCENPKRTIAQLLTQFFPKAFCLAICRENKIPEIEGGQVSKIIRRKLADILKHYPLTIVSAHDLERATVTRGGVDTVEIDPKTMQSKLCGGLFFAGEVMNVDGPCGGYNLQFAFSSGFLAGKSAVMLIK